MQDGRTGTELVPVSPYGPFHRFVDRIRELNIEGRVHDALAEIDLFEWIAEAFGDRRTADFMLQRRMYTYLHLQQHEPALSIGAQLVARHRASGNLLGVGRASHVQILTGTRALALAKLGRTDEALALAQRSIAGPGTGSYTHPELWTAHLALAVASRARGEFTAARRELVAAEHLVSRGIRADDRLLVQYELATLTAEVLGRHVETVGADTYADVLGALQGQAQQLWRQRRQRMTMLRQARQREQLEIEHARAHAALLRDPLTGLGNRRHFDQLMADIYAGNHPSPTTLLLVDVDNFKSINDTHSHSAGDEIL